MTKVNIVTPDSRGRFALGKFTDAQQGDLFDIFVEESGRITLSPVKVVSAMKSRAERHGMAGESSPKVQVKITSQATAEAKKEARVVGAAINSSGGIEFA